MSILESAVAAMRVDDAAADDGEATRARLVRSLESRERKHRQLVTLVTILVVLLGGTVSWAWTTGRIHDFFSGSHDPAPKPPVRIQAASAEPARPRNPSGAIATPAPAPEMVAPAPEMWPVAPDTTTPAPIAAPAKKITPAPKPAPAPAPAEVLYRKAHELHFRGTDREAALAAWDAYLAAEPTGRFAIEARFNRAIILVRLDRYAEAVDAFEPFARGEVTPVGYRQDEAIELVARLHALMGLR